MLDGPNGCLVFLPWLVSVVACVILLGQHRLFMSDWKESDHEFWYGDLHRPEDPAYIIKNMLEAPSLLT